MGLATCPLCSDDEDIELVRALDDGRRVVKHRCRYEWGHRAAPASRPAYGWLTSQPPPARARQRIVSVPWPRIARRFKPMVDTHSLGPPPQRPYKGEIDLKDRPDYLIFHRPIDRDVDCPPIPNEEVDGLHVPPRLDSTPLPTRAHACGEARQVPRKPGLEQRFCVDYPVAQHG